MVDVVQTKVFRGSYVNIFKPVENKKSKKMQYSITAIFDSKAEMENLIEAVNLLLTEKFGTKKPEYYRKPWRSGQKSDSNPNGWDLKKHPYYEGKIVIPFTANIDYPPGIVDKNVHPITDQKICHSGAFYRATVRPFWYDTDGNAGVSFGLNNVQFIRAGEPLGGIQTSPESDFTPFADGSEASDIDL